MQETRRVRRETLGDRHASTLIRSSNLANLQRAQGKLAEAAHARGSEWDAGDAR